MEEKHSPIGGFRQAEEIANSRTHEDQPRDPRLSQLYVVAHPAGFFPESAGSAPRWVGVTSIVNRPEDVRWEARATAITTPVPRHSPISQLRSQNFYPYCLLR